MPGKELNNHCYVEEPAGVDSSRRDYWDDAAESIGNRNRLGVRNEMVLMEGNYAGSGTGVRNKTGLMEDITQANGAGCVTKQS